MKQEKKHISINIFIYSRSKNFLDPQRTHETNQKTPMLVHKLIIKITSFLYQTFTKLRKIPRSPCLHNSKQKRHINLIILHLMKTPEKQSGIDAKKRLRKIGRMEHFQKSTRHKSKQKGVIL